MSRQGINEANKQAIRAIQKAYQEGQVELPKGVMADNNFMGILIQHLEEMAFALQRTGKTINPADYTSPEGVADHCKRVEAWNSASKPKKQPTHDEGGFADRETSRRGGNRGRSGSGGIPF